MDILNRISSPADVKALPESELPALCTELRNFLVQSVSRTGGHLASNLGAVELTVALHRVFDTAVDRLVFDVGHQSYVHKILTGRREQFGTLRQYGGLSGFPKPTESIHDAFIAGHASNSIAVGLGMARARTLQGQNYSVISVIGDGALTGGLAYEALCDAGASSEPLIIILNDNGMSITKNVGGMARYLSKQRMKPKYITFKKRYKKLMMAIPGGRYIYRFTHSVKSAIKETLLHCSMFEEMGLQYLGPVDGHDVYQLIEIFRWAKNQNQPILLHIITTKGKGYSFSEENPDKYHGVSKFDPRTGITVTSGDSFSSAFGAELVRLAEGDARITAVTAAMTSGTGLTAFSKAFPSRFFDVGIAEGHGAAMAAGMAAQKMLPVFAVYSTFLQRSYDMLIHDVALSGLHVVFAVDRAGLVGDDGETHHGVFDVAYLTSVPGMTVWAPASYAELRDMLKTALYNTDGPVAVRYPRGSMGRYTDGGAERSKCVRTGADFTIVTYGISVNTALDAADILVTQGISTEIVKLGCICPVDMPAVLNSVKKTKRLLVLEECVENGCVGEKIAAAFAQLHIQLDCILLKNLGNCFVVHGKNEILRREYGIDATSIVAAIVEAVTDEQDPS